MFIELVKPAVPPCPRGGFALHHLEEVQELILLGLEPVFLASLHVAAKTPVGVHLPLPRLVLPVEVREDVLVVDPHLALPVEPVRVLRDRDRQRVRGVPHLVELVHLVPDRHATLHREYRFVILVNFFFSNQLHSLG